MKSHYLNDFTFNGKDLAIRLFPQFDFNNLKHVTQLKIVVHNCETADIAMSARYHDPISKRNADIVVNFIQSRRMICPETFPFIYFSGIEIENLAGDQIEGIKYVVSDYDMNEFSVMCRDIEIAECILVDDS